MACVHEVKALIGCADGIKCTACGKVFKNFNEVLNDRKETVNEVDEKPVKEQPKTKPATKRKAPAKK